MTPIYYEPQHSEAVAEDIRLALALRGYTLTRDEAAMPDSLTVAWAMVTVEPDGRLTLYRGDVGTDLPPVERWPSPAAYAVAVARWLAGETDGVEVPSVPERTLAPVELVQLVVSGARTLTARIHQIDEAAHAAQIAEILDEVVSAAERLRAEALRIADGGAA